MAITITSEHVRTFGELKAWALEQAGVSNHFEFRDLGENYATYWEGMNRAEFDRGYVHGEYEKPDTPALCDMKLLTEKEFRDWKGTFEFFHEKK
ncbi:hypothetical protein A2765_04930 [Candidatus Kaiserbacteria bacterium RIFCSPHIGHO2_01_FULL_56_24]|uniref:Uncharacterized protein n=1 Tax=Candidatus Kaiserbacteria bacterium RIFCSPHIGHO2_01_FULL_56_24 TaxID=1798487 RepID=A0A1F6D8V1_9BACT|nr:MAG: hypothetical protein A2765_04930 [Candidatus Kaiserbacteria bacterium RIFCSPHIGHO2_01_FULL_56_24]